MKLIIGLGNPGTEYDKTRHNIGFYLIDNYVNDRVWKNKFNSLYYETKINSEKVIFVKPQTYMNLSGKSIIEFVKYYDLNIEDILVIHDDKDQEFSKFKLKKNSSAGGHNGIKSIISTLGTDSFLRLKVGIANNKMFNIVDFVLGKFTTDEMKVIDSMIPVYNKIIENFVVNDANKLMNEFNNYESNN